MGIRKKRKMIKAVMSILALTGNALELSSVASDEVCILKSISDPAPGFKTMSMADV